MKLLHHFYSTIVVRPFALPQQIRDRGYADAYLDDPRPVWLIGCNYNPETRNLDKASVERLKG